MADKKDRHGYEPVGDLVSIFQRSRRWYANFQSDGRQHRMSLGTTSKKEARRRALLLEAELLEGRYNHQPKPRPIEAVVEAYMKYARTEGRAKKTLAKYGEVYKRVVAVAARLRRGTILGVDLKFIDEYRHERVAAGLAAKTVYNETMIIRQLVNFALSRRMIKTDPLAGLKLKEPKPNPQPCWSPDEVDRILAASSEPQRWAFAILADTGMRIGELQHLTWDDVDVERNVLHVRAKENWAPKTGDQRAVPMTPAVRMLLEQLPWTGRWVLTARPTERNPKNDRQISERRLLVCLKRVLNKLGLSGHLHTFRHDFISRALTSGIPEAVVRSWVGHVDRDVLKLYTHIADADSQAAMRRLGENNNKDQKDKGKEVDQKQQGPNGQADGPVQDATGGEEDSAQFQHNDERSRNDDSAK